MTDIKVVLPTWISPVTGTSEDVVYQCETHVYRVEAQFQQYLLNVRDVHTGDGGHQQGGAGVHQVRDLGGGTGNWLLHLFVSCQTVV